MARSICSTVLVRNKARCYTSTVLYRTAQQGNEMKGVRAQPQVAVRMPPDLKRWLQVQASDHMRSLNAEIVVRLQTSRTKGNAPAALTAEASSV